MNSQRQLGLVLLVVGIMLLVLGITASDSVADRWNRFFTGRYTDSTVWCMLVGGAASIAGMVTMFGGRRSTSV